MFNFYKHCLFCLDPLPEKPSGVGEHVFPKGVYGFWRIYDVCKTCMKHFGDNVDQLPFQNPHILKAIEQLKLPKAEQYYGQITYEGTDTVVGHKVEMIRKNGTFKTKAQELNVDFFECSEDDWHKIGVNWLKQRTNLSEEEFDKEIVNLKEQYNSLNPGEIVTSSKLGFSIKKRSVRDVSFDESGLDSISPLIAKIVVSYLHYILNVEELVTLYKIETLINHARYLKDIPPFMINWYPLLLEPEYKKFHRVLITFLGKSILVDVTFFGYPSWRILLDSDKPIVKYDRDGKLIEELLFILDFENADNRKKYLGFKNKDSQNPIFYEIEL